MTTPSSANAASVAMWIILLVVLGVFAIFGVLAFHNGVRFDMRLVGQGNFPFYMNYANPSGGSVRIHPPNSAPAGSRTCYHNGIKGKCW